MDESHRRQPVPFSRRLFIRQGAVFLAGSMLVGSEAFGFDDPQPKLRLGLVTDLHYADKPSVQTRCYRETPTKLAAAAKRFELEKVDLVIELGDIIDSAKELDVEKGYLRRIAKDFAAIHEKHYHVLGNHWVATSVSR